MSPDLGGLDEAVVTLARLTGLSSVRAGAGAGGGVGGVGVCL